MSLDFPGFDRLYSFSDPVLSMHFRARMEVDLDTALALDTGTSIPSNPIPVRHAMGSDQPGDVIWTTFGIPVVVSQRVVELLEAERITGWSTYPIVLYGEAGNEMDGYFGLATTGRCGPIDYSASRPTTIPVPGGRQMTMYEGQCFDPATWDRSHLFLPVRGHGGRFATEAVKTVFERANIRNVEFKPMSKALVSPDTVAKRLRQAANPEE